jgi:serine phosphatase RsbU (regulator of sigma subunit)
MIHKSWMQEIIKDHIDTELIKEKYPDFVLFEELTSDKQKLYFELIYIIPIVFKNAGYEIIRKSEAGFINIGIAEKLARVIHSKFLKLMTSRNDISKSVFKKMSLFTETGNQYISDFDSLDEDIKQSNIDNVYHVPTKLLSIGYKIQKVAEDNEPPLLVLTEHETETMAKLEHTRWCWERRINGWTYAKKRNNNKKQHNSLVPYEDLSEEEKEKDRILIRFIPALLKDINYEAVFVSPEMAENITYIKTDWGQISEIRTELSLLKTHLPANISKKIRERINNIENKVTSLKDDFANGKRVQNCFIPSIIKFKEYLPDSFVLYKPKEIVSGDFYFISKLNNVVVFSAADCTGHSISAAILTAICYNYLDIAVNKNQLSDPSDILGFVIPQIEYILNHDKKSYGDNFGMDITVCSLNIKTNKLLFSGFGTPLYFFRRGEFNEIKWISSNMSYSQAKEEIKTHNLQLNRGDTVYICTDGISDQFGGTNNKKFGTTEFKSLLKDIQDLSIYEQCEKLNQTIENWKKQGAMNQVQTDDILVIGVKI